MKNANLSIPQGWSLPTDPIGTDSAWKKKKKANLANQDQSKALDKETES